MASNFICFKCDSKLPNLAGCGFIEDRVTQATSWEEGRSALQTPCSMPTSQCKVRAALPAGRLPAISATAGFTHG